jgi:predicted NUDIX family phosphoesterase
VLLHQRLTQQVEQELHHLYLAVQLHMQAVVAVDHSAHAIQAQVEQVAVEQVTLPMQVMDQMELPIVAVVAVDLDLLEHALEVQVVLELLF